MDGWLVVSVLELGGIVWLSTKVGIERERADGLQVAGKDARERQASSARAANLAHERELEECQEALRQVSATAQELRDELRRVSAAHGSQAKESERIRGDLEVLLARERENADRLAKAVSSIAPKMRLKDVPVAAVRDALAKHRALRES